MDRFLDVAQLSHSGKSGVRRDRRAGYRLLPHSRRLYMAYHGMERTRDCDSPAYLGKSEERGWDLFLSSHLHHGRTHHNYYIAGEGEHAGKVVEKNSAGEEVRPMDFSLTKNVCGLFLSCGLLLFIVLRTAHWYKKHPNEAPGGFIGLMEMAISYIQDGVIKEAIGKEYKPFSSYLLTVFSLS